MIVTCRCVSMSPAAAASSSRVEGKRTYAVAVCAFASLGGVFFGYDQGVTGGILVMRSFVRDFCIGYDGNTAAMCWAASDELPQNWLDFTTLYNVLYYIGCIGGAYLGGRIADHAGRRMTIVAAGAFFTIGTIWMIMTPLAGHLFILIGRIIQGVGVGASSFCLPLFGAEMAPKELRGMLSGFMQMSVVSGILLAGVVNYAIQDNENGWRETNAVAIVFPVVVMIGVPFCPESPRWLYKAKGCEKAARHLRRLRQTDHIDVELKAIGDAIDDEGEGDVSWSELMHPSLRRRIAIAMSLQVLQQATGINPVFVYGGEIFKDVAGEGFIALIILQAVNFISTIPALHWVDSCGRRKLLLIGALGMALGHIVSGIAYSAGCVSGTCTPATGWIMIAATAFFICNFAISWGPICWIYPAEIFPMRVRAKAVSLSTMMNWTMGAAMIGIPKLFPYLHINGVFFLFGVFCLGAGAFVYKFCPETRHILLEDIHHLFNTPKDIHDPQRMHIASVQLVSA